MSAIINLYVARDAAAPDADAFVDLITALSRQRFLAYPASVGPPLDDKGNLVDPQTATAIPSRPFPKLATSHDALGSLQARLTSARTPLLVLFGGLDATNPIIQKEFDHYRGHDCSVAFFSFPAGRRLTLVSEFDQDVVFDRNIFEWLHLQGKAAVWKELFLGSSLNRVVTSHWHRVEVVENDSQ